LIEVTVTAIRDQLPGSRRDWHQRIECPLTMFIKPGTVSVGWRRRLADDEEADGQQHRFKNHNCTFDQIVRRRSAELGYWPLLRSMQKSQDDDLFACLPYIPFPGDLRLINLFWGVVYGAGLWVIDGVVTLRQQSPVVLLYILAWPLAVSCGLFIIGNKLHQTSHSRLRLFLIWIMIASSLAVTRVDRSLQPPFSNLPTFYKICFTIY
jgi:hypothetical protein